MSRQENSNLISFRLNDAALFLVQRNKKVSQSMSSYCQELLYKELGINDPEYLNKDTFADFIGEVVDARLSHCLLDMEREISVLKEQVQTLSQPKSTARKPRVNKGDQSANRDEDRDMSN